MASKSQSQPEVAAHLYRYRTPALVGPWRKTARQAELDALRAHQARRDDRDRHAMLWLVPGQIEELETTREADRIASSQQRLRSMATCSPAR